MKVVKIMILFLTIFLISCQAQDITNEGSERQTLLVEVAQVTEQSIQKNVELHGQALPKNQVPLFTPTPLVVTQVHKSVGDPVEKGELIISLNDDTAKRQVEQAKKIVTELQNALNQVNQLAETAKQNINTIQNLEKELQASFQRTEELLKDMENRELEDFVRDVLSSTIEISTKQAELSQRAGAIPQVSPANAIELEMQIATAEENVRQAELALQATQLKAPFTGVIAQLEAIEGQTALPNSPLTTVVVLNPIMATFSANSFQIGLLEEGLPAQISVEGIQEAFPSTISTISPMINPQTNAFTVEVAIDNPTQVIKGGMRVSTIINLDEIVEALVIPVESILYEENEPYVFVVNDEEMAVRRQIQVGVRDGVHIEVVDGLKINERVVTTGKERLTDGAQITIRNE